MGMAASQARYLALVARKSNCEYEGQQINQARTALSNQSANLFNQMLGLQVPIPPSTSDFTKTQYSFTDGLNASTIDSWQQLANNDENYNYVVTHHYYTDVYTGSQKKLSDPQVQFGGTVPVNVTEYGDRVSLIQQYKVEMDNRQKAYDDANAAYQALLSQSKTLNAYRDSSLFNSVVDSSNNVGTNSFTIHNQVTAQDASGKTYTAWVDKDKTEPTKPDYYYDGKNYYTMTTANGVNTFTPVADIGDIELVEFTEEINFAKYNADQGWVKDAFEKWNQMLGGTLNPNDLYYGGSGSDNYFVFAGDLAALTGQPTGAQTILPIYHINGTTPDDAKYYTIDGMDTALSKAKSDLDSAKTLLGLAENAYKSLSVPEYIGNSALTNISALDPDQEAEIAQIIKDMKKNEIETNLEKYYNVDSGEYNGGIYSFKLNGITYYTTYDDLANSAVTGNGINNIDGQIKLPYYNATYVSTKIEKTEKALIETDGYGRFTSVRFEDDSVTYSLNMETVTDDVAYQDAMNQYYYENAKYDKLVQDINAKTSIIQQQDLQLELRLKQLDTEQSALSTEMEAVKKVVDDNVEKSFKTFNG